jgi:hypothetical protein
MNKPSRRAVVRTGVWAVPAVTVAAATPAFATVVSGGGCVGEVCLSASGHACKLPGHSTHNNETYYGYRMLLNFTNDSGDLKTVTIDSITFSGGATIVDPGSSTIIVDPSCTSPAGCDYVVFIQSTNSANHTAVVCFTVDGQQDCASVIFPSFNPCKCDPKDADPTDPASNCA